jgi:hypothetical protein
MHRADRAVLQLAIGLGLSVLVAYGLALPVPFLVCVMAVLILSRPGPPLPLLRGALMAVVIGVMMAAGVLMVPLLEHYAATGIVLTGVLLYLLFFSGALAPSPLTLFLVFAVTLMPVAGVADQALVGVFSSTLAVGIGVGVLVAGVAHAFVGDDAPPDGRAGAPAGVGRRTAHWIAFQATIVVMPVFVLALTNPSFYIPAMLKAVALGQQSGATSARSAGQELVGSTLAGAAIALVMWCALSLRPNLWMLVLWMVAAGLWVGARLFGVRATSVAPTFWINALITMLLLIGPAIEDSAVGKDVLTASAVRTALFVAAALYAWAAVWTLERWRGSKAGAPPPGSD